MSSDSVVFIFLAMETCLRNSTGSCNREGIQIGILIIGQRGSNVGRIIMHDIYAF